MTPRVVRTVEELRAGMVLRDANGCVGEVFMALGRLEFSRTNGGSTTLVATDRSLFPATILAPLSVTAEQARGAFRDFIDSFNGDEAGDVDIVGDIAGNTGFVPTGGNDLWHVFLKALAALGIEVES